MKNRSIYISLIIFHLISFYMAQSLQAQLFEAIDDNVNIWDLNDRGEYVGHHLESGIGFLYLPVPDYGLPAGYNHLLGPVGESALFAKWGHGIGVSRGYQNLYVWENGSAHNLDILDVLFPFDGFEVADMNNSGQMIGYHTFEFGDVPLYWDGTMITYLDHPFFTTCDDWRGKSILINDLGDIYGQVTCWQDGVSGSVTRNVIWDSNGALVDDFGNDTGFFANEMNNSRQVLFRRYIHEPGQYTQIPMTQTVSINDHGQIVGWSLDADLGFNQPMLWLPSAAYGLPAGLHNIWDIAAVTAYSNTVATALQINNRGEIIVSITGTGGTNSYINLLLYPPQPSFVVNSVADDVDTSAVDGVCATQSGDCTLRAAIMEANAHAGIDAIEFNIPGLGIPVIQPGTELPEITDTIFVNGGSQRNTGKVEINGSQIVSEIVDGLRISAGNSVVSGLLINKFSGNGLTLISGNSNTVEDVIIGIDADGITSRGNLKNGIYIVNSSDNLVGNNTNLDAGNVIAFNGGSGVFVESGERNTVRLNSIYSNAGLGIDLEPVDINFNDTLDIDIGANTLLNNPVIDSFAIVQVAGQSPIFGHIQGALGAAYTVDIFASGSCHPSRRGDGKTWLASVPATANSFGRATFEVTVNHVLTSSEVFTATATDAAGNTSEFSPCIGLIHLEIVDVDKIPLTNLNFIVSSVKVASMKFDEPQYAETLLDTFFADSEGIISLPGHMLEVGDSVKVYRYLGSVPAVRHPVLLGTMYSVHLDNAKFDGLGKISYLEITTADIQRVVMDHSTFAYNMLISIAWDAELAYLDAWKPSMRKMANHLYDVSDGQMTIDTVLILDNSAGWDEADVQVHANNILWFHVLDKPGGMLVRPGFFAGGPVQFPRTGYDSEDGARALSVLFDPAHMLSPNHYMPVLHEFFHWAFSFGDEYKTIFNAFYLDTFGERCPPRQGVGNGYGVMDQQLPIGQPYSSEFSSVFRYVSGCKNNRQWWLNWMSCWDQVDAMLEKSYSGIKAPVIRPDERQRMPFVDYIPGPNENAHIKDPLNMDFDAGALVVFPAIHIPPTSASYNVLVVDQSGEKVKGGVRVRQDRKVGRGIKSIEQGETSDQGRLLALGINVGDILFSSLSIISALGPNGYQWGYNTTTIQPASQGNGLMSMQSGNDLILVMDTVKGVFPLVPRLILEPDQVTLSLDYQKRFPDLPAVEHVSAQGDLINYDFFVSGNSYVATVTDSILKNDMLTIQAVDDSGSNFFIPAHLSLSRGSSVDVRTLRDEQFGVEVIIDSLNIFIENSSLLTWSYPLIRAGIDSLARQAGDAVALAIYPDILLSGENSISIRYGDNDGLSGAAPFGDKLSLQIFRWNETGFTWESLGGDVDTNQQVVITSITQPGTYAAFTTELLPSCCSGSTGNIDCDPGPVVDITDLTVLIDHLFIGMQPLCCKEAANVDGDPAGIIDITDLTFLIEHLFISLVPTSACQ